MDAQKEYKSKTTPVRVNRRTLERIHRCRLLMGADEKTKIATIPEVIWEAVSLYERHLLETHGDAIAV